MFNAPTISIVTFVLLSPLVAVITAVPILLALTELPLIVTRSVSAAKTASAILQVNVAVSPVRILVLSAERVKGVFLTSIVNEPVFPAESLPVIVNEPVTFPAVSVVSFILIPLPSGIVQVIGSVVPSIVNDAVSFV